MWLLQTASSGILLWVYKTVFEKCWTYHRHFHSHSNNKFYPITLWHCSLLNHIIQVKRYIVLQLWEALADGIPYIGSDRNLRPLVAKMNLQKYPMPRHTIKVWNMWLSVWYECWFLAHFCVHVKLNNFIFQCTPINIHLHQNIIATMWTIFCLLEYLFLD